MDEERWQESLNARNTLAANQAIYAAWSAAWTAEATDNIINIYKHFTLRGQRCPYTLQIVDAFSRQCAANGARPRNSGLAGSRCWHFHRPTYAALCLERAGATPARTRSQVRPRRRARPWRSPPRNNVRQRFPAGQQPVSPSGCRQPPHRPSLICPEARRALRWLPNAFPLTRTPHHLTVIRGCAFNQCLKGE